MPEARIDHILEQVRSRDPQEAWSQFLEEYSGLIFQVIRHFERDADLASDCFQFVCERLSENGSRRLLRFKPQGPASFSTWLRAVVRNLCLDWHRKHFGRPRVFKSISRLSAFDQEVFRYVYERGVSFDETLLLLRSNFPVVTPTLLAESTERIQKELTKKQRWLLRARFAERSQETKVSLEEPEATIRDVPDPRPNPEAQAALRERAVALQRALGRLSQRERLLMRLRFEEELTLDQVATLLDLGNAQRAERQIKAILARLRQEFE